MCGRYSITTNPEAMRRLFGFMGPTPNLEPRYNAAPTQPLPVIRLDKQGQRRLVALRWGLVPSWADDVKVGARMINARAETVERNSSFRNAFQRRRCLVPADGFYEWHATKEGRLPWRFTMKDGEPFAFAGLWEFWKKQDQVVESFTIIVTQANALVGSIHDRMPVILDIASYEEWLSGTDPSRLLALLKPFPAEGMAAHRVSPRVNDWKNDDVDVTTPID
jgi:putative SOS response-associated peptidase YedK